MGREQLELAIVRIEGAGHRAAAREWLDIVLARVRELEAEAQQHREEVDELATELAEERTLTQELQAERDELRAALERIVHELDWGNEDGNIFPAAALRIARAALRSPAGPSTDEDKP